MPDYVRAEVNGQHVTTTRAHAQNAGLKVLDEPAVDGNGRPLAATRSNGRRNKPRTSVDQAASKSTRKKSTASKRAAKKSTSGGSTATTQEDSK